MPIERLVNLHKDAVYRQMVRVCGNHPDAEDALAEAIVAALKASDKIRDQQAFAAWLSAVAVRSCARERTRSHLKSMTSMDELVRLGLEPASTSASPLESATLEHSKECVRRAVAHLSKDQRETYEAIVLEGLSASEVAARFGIRENVVRTRLCRARQALRQSLESQLMS